VNQVKQPIPPPTLFAVGRITRVELGRAENGRSIAVPSEFLARYPLPGATVDLTIKAQAGKLRASMLTVTEDGEQGLRGVTLDGISIAQLLEDAGERMAWMSGAGTASPLVGPATRRRLSDDRLREVAEAYRSGGIDAVKEQQHVGERQAWRLRRRAVEAGLLEADDEGEGS
jgi:hypothetical protein